MLGLLFPGQGSQHIGMGQFLYDNFKVAKDLFEEASDTLSFDFKKLCFTGEEKDLALTQNTQPALLLNSMATFRVLKETLGIQPKGAAGHSVGEYAAVVSAGGLVFAQALKLVRLRGELMQVAVPLGQGAMIAVMGLSEPEVKKFCQWAEEESQCSPVEPANFNSPQQIVVSGDIKAIEWARANFTCEKIGIEKKKVRLIPLKVSAPFHCSLMQKAQDGMTPALEKVSWQSTQWPIAQNITGNFYSQPDDLKKNLISQITGAVKWTHCIRTLRENGIENLIECGPGKVLTGLVKKIDGQPHPSWNLNSLDDLKALEKGLNP